MPVEDVIGHIRRLDGENVREVVLTGIHLGMYGEDLSPPFSLVGVVGKILAETTIGRLRLSSIEPTEIDAELIDLMTQFQGRVCRHLHIPLQSGADETLRRMGRPYTARQFADIIKTVRERIPDAAIGVDVMAGFPGESDSAFQSTYRLIERLPVTYLHVFPYSPRKGTPAADYSPKVPERITKQRCRELRLLGEKKRTAFLQSMLDRQVEVLTQTASDPSSGCATGLSDNYVPVTVVDSDVGENEILTVRIVEVTSDGKAIGKPSKRN